MLLGQFGVLHFQQCEGRLETRKRLHSFGPAGNVGPAPQVESADFGKGCVAVAEQIRNGGLRGAEKVAISEVRIQHPQRRLGTPAMVVGNSRRDIDWTKFSLAELNAVTVEDGRKQRIDVPV